VRTGAVGTGLTTAGGIGGEEGVRASVSIGGAKN
jgi:hypothetical protein